jgi:hypothetical protein
MWLVWKESPVRVRSDIGVPGAIAPGRASFSCFARNTVDSVSAPPAEVPKIAMFFGSAIFNAPFQTARLSSSAAG